MYDWIENYYQHEDNISRSMHDLDFLFKTHPISKDVRKKKNVESIKQSIRTLVMLNHYEKPFHPDIGCDIYKSLFELMSEGVNEYIIETNIRDVLNKYEPRAEITEVNVELFPDNNSVNITIYFIPHGYTEQEKVNIFLQILR